MKKVLVLVAALSVASCAIVGEMDNKQKFVAAASTVAGALIGYQLGGGNAAYLYAAGGAVAGGLFGLSVAQNLDFTDRWSFDKSAANSFDTSPDGITTSWSNPQTGHNGSFTPVNSYKTAQGFTCRDIYLTVNGKSGFQLEKMTACQQPDGAWRFVGSRGS